MAPLKLLWLKTGPLHPLDTGGKIRTYNMLRELNRRHELTYLSLCPPGCDRRVLAAAAEYSGRQVWIPWQETRKGSLAFYAELARNSFSRMPYVIAKYRSHRMTEEIHRLETELRPDLIICDFLTPAVNLFANGGSKTRTLLFQHNVESLIWRRLYENSGGLKRLYFRQQWRRLESFERDVCRRCDGVVGVSAADCQIMRREFGLSNVLGEVPTGVDTSFYAPMNAERKPQSLVFLGSMDWMANIDGACWFADAIFPLIREPFPQVTLTIVGRKPTPRVLELAQKHPGIRVTGTVEDVRPFLAESQVLVVPLRVGGGTRLKIFEGMATGIPVVSTRIGAEGLPVTHEQVILLADSPGDFAGCVTRLLASEPLRARIGDAGLKLVRERCGWERITDVFEQYCLKMCQN
jgi:glycosyltransferase involved in cell wall biosynthesis